MNDKTKDELIAEMQALLQENNSLKESLHQSINLCKQVKEASAQLNGDILKLNQFAVELAMLSPEEDLKKLIIRLIKEFSGARFAMFSNYDPASRTLTTEHIEMESGLLEKFVGMVSKKGKPIRSEVNDEMFQYITKEVAEVRKNLHDVSFGAIPRPLASAIQTLLKVDRFIGISYLVNGELYGTSLLGMPKDKPDPQMQILKNFISLASVSLRRKQAEEKIREKNMEFRKLSANVPDLLFQFTRRPDGTYFVPIASEGIKNIFGCSPEDVLNDFTPIGKVIFQEDHERVISEIEYSAKHLKFFTCEFRVQIPGKEIQWIYSKSTPERLPDGSITWYGFNTDITERKLADEALRETNELLSLFIRNSPIYAFIKEITPSESRVLLASDNFEQMIGVKGSDMIGKTTFELFPHDLADKILEDDLGVVTSWKMLEVEEELNGQSYNTIKFPIIRGGKTLLAGFTIDITDRKQAEETLLKKDLLLNITGHTAKVGGWELDVKSMKLTWTDEVYILHEVDFSYDPNVDSGLNFYTPSSRPIMEEALQRAIEFGEPFDFELEFVTQKGHLLWVHSIGVAQKEKGEIKKVFGSIQDISEHKFIEQELIIAKENAEESDRLKSAFLANMSHEIRTPMNGILGFSNLLSEPGLESEEQQEYVKIIQKSGARMLNILSEIMDISKIESGLTEVNITHVNINKQVEFVYELLKPDADHKAINLLIKHSLSTNEATIQTDGGKLYGILSNLVKNAIKYTDAGSVEFGYDMVQKNGLPAVLQFYVKDTGIGIAKGRQEAIFERFIQADIADVQ
ncbi:MAG: histidine kinase dimerization/phospho-acceptor domain-containing protein, partial [Prolixibacteraceae bacterium]